MKFYNFHNLIKFYKDSYILFKLSELGTNQHKFIFFIILNKSPKVQIGKDRNELRIKSGLDVYY